MLGGGCFKIGSSVCHVIGNDVIAYFPNVSQHYNGLTINFRVEFDDAWNFYLRFSRKHNTILKAYPVATIRLLPELFD